MELDDQFAALVAGDLDEDTARALRARAASDPALARRLARHEELHRLLRAWEAPGLSDAATDRLTARMDAALAALDDGPLTADVADASTPAPLPDQDDTDDVVAPVGDLTAARQRRERRGDRSSWGPGLAVAAALAVVVGGGVLLGDGDVMSSMDTLAGGGSDEAAEDTAEETADVAMDAEMAEEGEEVAESAITEAAPTAEGGAAGWTAGMAPTETGVTVTPGGLLDLLDGPDEGDGGAEDGGTTSRQAVDECVAVALERDSAPRDGRTVQGVATGTYDGSDAVFVVVASPGDGGDTLFEVIALDATGCGLLERTETTR